MKIIATDNNGREEKLSLNLSKTATLRLLIAEQGKELKTELNAILNECHYGHFNALSPYQYKRLKNFVSVINNVFYNYNLKLE